MINRNPKIRILAVLVVLALVCAGAAPARTVCTESCCFAAAECHGKVTPRVVGSVHCIPLTAQIPGLFYRGDGTDTSALPHHSNSDCRMGLTQSPCNMDESPDTFETLQGTSPAPSRNERCQDVPFTPGLYSPSLEHHLTAGLLAEHKKSARAAPIPVFLRTLSLLI